MQIQLEKLEKDYGIEWLEYRLDEVFNNIVQGRRLKKQDQISGNLPFVMSGVTNSGIVGYIGNNIRIFPKNSITVDIFGNVFYRNYEYGMGDDTGAYWNDDVQISKHAMLYIATVLQKFLVGKFDYAHKLRSSRSVGFKIKLPTISKDGVNEIACDFMEVFIKTIQAERLSTLREERLSILRAYLLATNLKDYQLTLDERKALDDLTMHNTKEFKIEDILVWQKNIAEISPLDLDKLSISHEEKYPFYGQATSNRGIIEYRYLTDKVLNNKLGKSTILIHSNNQNIVYLDTPFYLKDGHGATSVLQSENLNESTAQFLIAAIKKVISQKYNYNAKATKIELKKTIINLPIKSDDTPDYTYMISVTVAMQKVVIKNMIDDLDKRIQKTEEILS